MTTHTYHPNVLEAGLASGCPRCEQLARNPWGLDAENIARISTGHVYSALDCEAEVALADIRNDHRFTVFERQPLYDAIERGDFA